VGFWEVWYRWHARVGLQAACPHAHTHMHSQAGGRGAVAASRRQEWAMAAGRGRTAQHHKLCVCVAELIAQGASLPLPLTGPTTASWGRAVHDGGAAGTVTGARKARDLRSMPGVPAVGILGPRADDTSAGRHGGAACRCAVLRCRALSTPGAVAGRRREGDQLAVLAWDAAALAHGSRGQVACCRNRFAAGQLSEPGLAWVEH
jgi:hypothetical protein